MRTFFKTAAFFLCLEKMTARNVAEKSPKVAKKSSHCIYAVILEFLKTKKMSDIFCSTAL